MSTQSDALLIEDDEVVRRGCEQALTLAGIIVESFGAAEPARARISADYPGIIICDVRLPAMDGCTLLREVAAIDREIPVILITGHGDITMAVQALKDGAYDFIEKPFGSDRLVEVALRAFEKRRLVLENRALRECLRCGIAPGLLGETPAIREVKRLIATLGPTDVDILIRGETGTGKDVVARAIHQASGRRGEYVAVNCGALPESMFESEIFGHEAGAFTGAQKRRIGKIEYAQGGTLFLDEIESMPLSLQVKILRVLQERVVERLGGNQRIPVDCRVIAATKEDLRRLSETGKFRADLYYRLHVVNVPLPPLRQRQEDIPLLLAYFLNVAAERYHCATPIWPPANLDHWLAHDWPGNVRELKHAAERYCLGLDPGLGSSSSTGPATGLAQRLDHLERTILDMELRRAGGSVALASAALQLPKKTLYDKLARYGMDPKTYRASTFPEGE